MPATFGHRVWLRAEDAHLGKGGGRARRRGVDAARPAGHPAAAETIALARSWRSFATPACASILCRLSTAEGVSMVRAAKREGLPVTCDVAVHHLHLCDVDIGWFDAQCRLIPPLRGTRDRAALRAGLADGTIDLVCSDHTPVDDDGKQVPFGEAEPGATGLELLLPLTLKWAHEDRIALPEAIARVTARPASVLGTDAGHLAAGAPGGHLHLRSGRGLADRAFGAQEPGQEHSLPRSRSAGQGRTTLVAGRVVYEA
jgi:dihydroorotase